MNPCNPYTWSALSPIKATEDMTHPVGQRDGKLFTAPTGGLPEFNPETMEGWTPQIAGGAIQWTPDLKNATADMLLIKATQAAQGAKIDEIYNGLVELSTVLVAINEGEVD